jgi:hypothetical protein
MRIDGSGRVTIPYQPYVYAYSNAPAATWNAGSTYTFPFNLTAVNTGSHFNTSTYAFTAPVAGRYLVQAQIQWNVSIKTNWVFNLYIARNGSGVAGTYQAGRNDGYDKQIVVGVINCSANDTIDIRAVVNQTTGGPETPTGDMRNTLFITLLG